MDIYEGEFIREEELLEHILNIIEDDLQEGFDKYDEIIMSCFPTCDECSLYEDDHNHCDDTNDLDYDGYDDVNP